MTVFRDFVRLRLTGSAAPTTALPPRLVIVSAIQRANVVFPILPLPIKKMALRLPDRLMAVGIAADAVCTVPLCGGRDRAPTCAADRARGASEIAPASFVGFGI